MIDKLNDAKPVQPDYRKPEPKVDDEVESSKRNAAIAENKAKEVEAKLKIAKAESTIDDIKKIDELKLELTRRFDELEAREECCRDVEERNSHIGDMLKSLKEGNDKFTKDVRFMRQKTKYLKAEIDKVNGEITGSSRYEHILIKAQELSKILGLYLESTDKYEILEVGNGI